MHWSVRAEIGGESRRAQDKVAGSVYTDLRCVTALARSSVDPGSGVQVMVSGQCLFISAFSSSGLFLMLMFLMCLLVKVGFGIQVCHFFISTAVCVSTLQLHNLVTLETSLLNSL